MCFYPHNNITGYFTILEHENLLINLSKLHNNHQSADFEAPQAGNIRLE